MGEIAEMMLEGLLDEESGEYIGDINEEVFGVKAPGFPVSYENNRDQINGRPNKVACPVCGRKVKPAGLRDHLRDVHGD
jgi:hypothetical protein